MENIVAEINPLQEGTGLVRYTQAIIFVGIYIALGFVLKLDSNVYLLSGIPLMLVFQMAVRKKPIYQLWVRDATDFHLNRTAWVLAVLFAIYPAYALTKTAMLPQFDWSVVVMCPVAILGAVATGYSFSRFTKNTFRNFFLCVAIAGTVGVLITGIIAFVSIHFLHKAFQPNFIRGVKWLLLYIPLSFALEEVVFRGMIDTHIHPDVQKRSLASAFFVSVLWGLWHLPITSPTLGIKAFALKTGFLIFAHSIVGVPLSIFWRRSGNLAVPAFTHSLIDAIRNIIL